MFSYTEKSRIDFIQYHYYKPDTLKLMKKKKKISISFILINVMAVFFFFKQGGPV